MVTWGNLGKSGDSRQSRAHDDSRPALNARQRLKNGVAVGRSLGVMSTSRLAAAAARSAPRVIGECLLSTQSRRSTGENEKCYRFEHLTESFSTECPSLSMMLAVIGQIEVMRCFTARTWALRKAGRG